MALETENRVHASISVGFGTPPTPIAPAADLEIQAASGIEVADFTRISPTDPGSFFVTLTEGIEDSELAIAYSLGYDDRLPTEPVRALLIFRTDVLGIPDPERRTFIVETLTDDGAGGFELVDGVFAITWFRIAQPAPPVSIPDVVP